MTAFYIISKIFSFFLYPAHWIYILLIIAFLTKKVKLRKRLLITSVVIFLLFSNQALLNLCVNSWQPKPVRLAPGTTYNAGIVLGGMSVVDRHKRGYMWEASDRFIQALRLYKQGSIKKIVVTGGSLSYEEPKEADFLKQQLVECGVNEADVIVENKSLNTFENATFSKRILDSLQLPGPYVLITSALHIPRSVRVFNKAGLQVVGYPANYEVVKENLTPDDFIFPKPKVLDIWRRFLKEITGIWIYKITGKA